MFARLLVAGSVFGFVAAAQAMPITNFQESLTSPLAPSGSTLTAVTLSGMAPSSTGFSGSGYSVTFTNLASGQGVVQGTVAGLHAVPVAGVSGGVPTYLTGGYGSAMTTDITASGSYLSTGGPGGQITITFTTPQSSLALLWGSIDGGNLLTLSGGSIVGADTLTGTQLQAISGFAGNGFQGLDGSAYVALSDATFTVLTFSSSVPSFEFTAVAGSNTPFSVPEPVSLMIFAGSLAVLGVARLLRA